MSEELNQGVVCIFSSDHFVIYGNLFQKYCLGKDLSLPNASFNCDGSGFRGQIPASAFPCRWWTSFFKVGLFLTDGINHKTPLPPTDDILKDNGSFHFLSRNQADQSYFPNQMTFSGKFIWTKNEVSSPQTPISLKMGFPLMKILEITELCKGKINTSMYVYRYICTQAAKIAYQAT